MKCFIHFFLKSVLFWPNYVFLITFLDFIWMVSLNKKWNIQSIEIHKKSCIILFIYFRNTVYLHFSAKYILVNISSGKYSSKCMCW